MHKFGLVSHSFHTSSNAVILHSAKPYPENTTYPTLDYCLKIKIKQFKKTLASPPKFCRAKQRRDYVEQKMAGRKPARLCCVFLFLLKILRFLFFSGSR